MKSEPNNIVLVDSRQLPLYYCYCLVRHGECRWKCHRKSRLEEKRVAHTPRKTTRDFFVIASYPPTSLCFDKSIKKINNNFLFKHFGFGHTHFSIFIFVNGNSMPLDAIDHFSQEFSKHSKSCTRRLRAESFIWRRVWEID